MKKYLFILILLIAFKSNAQTTAMPKLDDNAIVRDGAGNLIPTKLWRAYYQTGDYSFKLNKEKTEFIIYEMSPEEKIKAEERKQLALSNSSRPRLSTSFKDGEKFKGNKFTDINGNKYDLRELTGKVLVLNFWFINCPPCKREIPELNQLYTKYKDNKDVIFLAIALDEKYDLIQFLKTTPFNYNIVDDGRFYAEKYGVKSYPTHLVVGKDGLVKFHTTGLALNTVYWVEKTISEQLKGI
ncbi:MAG: TlpA disulfide reductase family protein [Pedobacter sp.]|jgi:thiol-disulfide isomerase/thioredoxin|uniref:TlpA family protein disulfide reductase n=1 Tax=Pedobacter sp. TaxID=1411316 RepID=UPI003568C6FF